MTERSIAHGSFTVKRSYPHSPAKVFRAWADPEIKRRWYGGDAQDETGRVFEFRVGGREATGGVAPTGEKFGFEIRYYDIVENQRIVYAYDVHIAGQLNSVSLASVEFLARDGGTEIRMTEQGAFLDGAEIPSDRIQGTEYVLDRLAEVLAEQN